MADDGRRQRYVRSVVLDANGTGTAEFVASNGSFEVQHVRVTVATTATDPNQSEAVTYIDGTEWEASFTGNSDQSDSTETLTSQQVLSCSWTGGTPGALATMIIRGEQTD